MEPSLLGNSPSPCRPGHSTNDRTRTRASTPFIREAGNLLGREVLVLVGYGTGKTEFMLSKLMAYEADIVGAWGCPPKYYPEALRLCLDRRITLEPFVGTRPMSHST